MSASAVTQCNVNSCCARRDDARALRRLKAEPFAGGAVSIPLANISLWGRFMTKGKLWLALSCLVVFSQPAIAKVGQSLASVYSYSKGKTASGESFSPTNLTAAHRSLPFGTLVRVTNLKNRLTVIVRINDRGPFTKGRIIDVSPAAADKLGFSGLAPVALDVVTTRY
jgi:rare lipoprotein A